MSSFGSTYSCIGGVVGDVVVLVVHPSYRGASTILININPFRPSWNWIDPIPRMSTRYGRINILDNRQSNVHAGGSRLLLANVTVRWARRGCWRTLSTTPTLGLEPPVDSGYLSALLQNFIFIQNSTSTIDTNSTEVAGVPQSYEAGYRYGRLYPSNALMSRRTNKGPAS